MVAEIRLKYDQIIKKIENQGFVRRKLVLTSLGNYHPDDADWNYKDIPHLKYIHKLIDNDIVLGNDKQLSSIAFQRFFGIFRIPMCLTNYDHDENSQIYYTSFLFFILLIKTSYEEIGTNKTKVTTVYNVFSPKILLFLVPLIKLSLRRNYKELMNDDIPMRERRGYLRSLGYCFKKDNKKYGFLETTKISEDRVIEPKNISFKISAINISSSDQFKNNNGNGYRVIKDNNKLFVFETLCMHEGADLSYADYANGKLICPWHGKKLKPILVFDNDGQEQNYKNKKFLLKNNKLIIK